jgi:hypothetical protein
MAVVKQWLADLIKNLANAAMRRTGVKVLGTVKLGQLTQAQVEEALVVLSNMRQCHIRQRTHVRLWLRRDLSGRRFHRK